MSALIRKYRSLGVAIASVLVASVLNLYSAVAFAENDWYYKAEVPVSAQTRQQRVAAAEQGFYDVLVRLSGSERVRSNTRVKQAASKAINYVQQFQYMSLTDPALTDQGYTNTVQLTYSASILRGLLKDAGESLWPIDRPDTLVWLVEDSSEYGKQVIAVSLAENDTPLIDGIRQAAAYRGLPLSFPLLDFQDQTSLTANQLWRLDEEAILAASERYGADAVLVGKVTTTSSGQTWSNWQFFHAGRNRVYDFRVDDPADVGRSAITPLADFLAKMYAIKLSLSDSSAVAVRINNVNSFADYRGVMATLEGKAAITAVALDSAQRDVLNLRLQSEADLNQLIRILALGDSLRLERESVSDAPDWQRNRRGSLSRPLVYRWVD